MPNIGAGRPRRFHDANEIFDQLFEENIVFPEGVVRVDQQCVASHRDPFALLLCTVRLFEMAVYQRGGIFGDCRSATGRLLPRAASLANALMLFKASCGARLRVFVGCRSRLSAIRQIVSVSPESRN